MSSFPNPLYDPSRRRRGRASRYNPPGSSHRSPLTSLATTAAIAYGVYRLGTWAWTAYIGDKDNNIEQEDEEDDENDFFNLEWTGDYRAVERDIRREEGFPSFCESEDETTDCDESIRSQSNSGGATTGLKQQPRSRRSRIDWSDNHERRSNSPSPPKDYHHHDDDGLVKRGVKKAAAAASSGIGTAVSAGITAGIEAYNRGNQPTADALLEQERRVRMGRCRLETSRAMMDFLPTLKKAVLKETDVSRETEELKRLRIEKKEIFNKKEENEDANADANQMVTKELNEREDFIRERERCLWNEIKIKSMTRLVTTVYAHTIVFLVLTVQVNLLGGRLLREEQDEKELSMGQQQQQITSAGGADRYRTSHQIVLAKTYHHLFAEGIPSLAKVVERAVGEILEKWNVLGDAASLRDVSTWIDRVRDAIEQRGAKTDGLSPLLKFVIPPEGESEEDGRTDESMETTDELARYILDETYDLLESPNFANTEQQCLDTTFDQMRTKVLGKLFLSEDRMPLATVVTHLQKTAVSTFHKPPSHRDEMKNWEGILGMMEEPLPSVPNDYLSKLERLEAVVNLADVCF
mmetsp:Transcript_44572/g.93539  ORF Transcript_44572/g.93539 Transcript_44572/m.93539 type:complete len:579 (-) Transcript_44572:165-1901(-)